MSDAPGGPVAEYAVSASGRVAERLGELYRLSVRRGDGAQFLAALAELERRLRIYPQFGDPLTDLTVGEGTVRVGIIRPLSIRYIIREDARQVLLVALPVLMSPERK